MFGLTRSDANEMLLKLARMYHTIKGESKRKIISRKYSYHGFTKAALVLSQDFHVLHLGTTDPNLYFEVSPYDLNELEFIINEALKQFRFYS